LVALLKERIEQNREWCYLIATMKKLILLFSVVAVAFALQAGGEACCSKDKQAACDKSKAASGPAKASAAGSACCAAKGSCSAKVAKVASAKKSVQSPKAAGEAR
jgi:hypothetical protein